MANINKNVTKCCKGLKFLTKQPHDASCSAILFRMFMYKQAQFLQGLKDPKPKKHFISIIVHSCACNNNKNIRPVKRH